MKLLIEAGGEGLHLNGSWDHPWVPRPHLESCGSSALFLQD